MQKVLPICQTKWRGVELKYLSMKPSHHQGKLKNVMKQIEQWLRSLMIFGPRFVGLCWLQSIAQ